MHIYLVLFLCVRADGVVMGADTRATAGSVVAVKNCSKLHVIQPNMIMAGAGTAADCDAVERCVFASFRRLV